VWRLPFPAPAAGEGGSEGGLGFVAGVREAVRALGRREVLRWLVLLRFGDFTSDVLRGFLALYFVDVAGASEGRAALAVVAWTCAVLAGDVLLIPVLERLRGLSYLRVSTACVLVLFPAFLLAEGLLTKFVLLALGAFAQRFGLEAMMWLLLFGPAALLAGLLTAPHDGGEKDGR
jgi:FSR family fosmidomycin resistance protein-like MFS transporter